MWTREGERSREKWKRENKRRPIPPHTNTQRSFHTRTAVQRCLRMQTHTQWLIPRPLETVRMSARWKGISWKSDQQGEAESSADCAWRDNIHPGFWLAGQNSCRGVRQVHTAEGPTPRVCVCEGRWMGCEVVRVFCVRGRVCIRSQTVSDYQFPLKASLSSPYSSSFIRHAKTLLCNKEAEKKNIQCLAKGSIYLELYHVLSFNNLKTSNVGVLPV